jgi:hypothetical protein
MHDPKIPLDYQAICQHTSAPFVTVSRRPACACEAKWPKRQRPGQSFSSVPLLSEIGQLEKFGLGYQDFALHDPLLDYLTTIQAQTTVLSDGRAMTQMLTEQAAKLREANRKLEAHHAVTQALAESGTLLEAALKILQALCITLNWDLGALWLFDEQASGML